MPAILPGLRMPFGSNSALRRAERAARAGGCGSKAEIAAMAVAFGVPVAATLSCYDPTGTAASPVHCGQCDACLLRRKGFAEAKLADPTTYAA